MELKGWQRYLLAQMDELDKFWKLKDDAWSLATQDLSDEMGELADLFHQTYWDVFRAAVECETREELEERVPDAIRAAQGVVVRGWLLIVDHQITRLDADIASVRDGGTQPLAQTRGILDKAKELRRGAETKTDQGDHGEAVVTLQNSLAKCKEADFQLDDARRAGDDARRAGLEKQQDRSWTQTRVIVAIAGLIVAIAAILAPLYLGGYFLAAEVGDDSTPAKATSKDQ